MINPLIKDNFKLITSKNYKKYAVKDDSSDDSMLIDALKSSLKKIDEIASYEEYVEMCNKFDIDTNKIYFNNVHSPLYYIDEEKSIYDEILMLNEDGLYRLKLRIEMLEREQAEAIKNGNYDIFYSSIPNKFKIPDFLFRYKQIHKKDIYSAFKYVYIESEYNHDMISKDLLLEIINLQKKGKTSIGDNEITIYRGECTLSTNIKKAYSWTTDYEIALFFAKRFSEKGGKVYKAKIKQKDILSDFEDEEKTVLCLYKNIYDIQEVKEA